MRIHTNTIRPGAIYDAARDAGAHTYKVEPHGSRSHERAYEVLLEGSSSKRTQNDVNRYAATWEEWGVFLAALYRLDPTIKAGPYTDAFNFHWRTEGQFL